MKAKTHEGGKARMKTKTDTYTRFILTVIAICLVWICVRNIPLIPKAYAAPADNIVDVRIRAIERMPGEDWYSFSVDFDEEIPVIVNNTNAIPVDIKNERIAVDVKNVEVQRTLTPIKK
jgi:hypothetical protein